MPRQQVTASDYDIDRYQEKLAATEMQLRQLRDKNEQPTLQRAGISGNRLAERSYISEVEFSSRGVSRRSNTDQR